jgi:lysozyme family protein
MSKFADAMELVFKHEGGFVDHDDDPGGATRYGISLRFLESEGLDIDGDGDIDADDIRALDIDRAAELYNVHFWLANNYQSIDPQIIANKIFDCCVNMGPRQAHKIAQRGCRAVGFFLVDDGILGPNSRRVLSLVGATGRAAGLLAAMRSEQAGFYRELIARKPELGAFRKGWMRRAYS